MFRAEFTMRWSPRVSTVFFITAQTLALGGQVDRSVETPLELRATNLSKIARQGESLRFKVELCACTDVWIPGFLEIGANLEALIIGPAGSPLRHSIGRRDYLITSRDALFMLGKSHCLAREITIEGEFLREKGIYKIGFEYVSEKIQVQDVPVWKGVIQSERVSVTIE